MANDVVFVKGAGGLGRPLAGTDHISGYLHYSATLPSGFSSGDRIKQVFSVADAEALGITNTHLGETKSTATYLFTNKGAAGDTFTITVASTLGTLTLASYTQVSADAVSVTTAGDRLALEVNNGTATHGWTALNSTGTVTLTAASGEGVYLNTGTPYVVTIVGTIAGTLTQSVVAGVASEIDVMHYHVSEYFRIQPKGNLYIGIYATADATTFASVTLMQDYALGALKQIGIYQKTTAFATSQCTTLQAILATNYTNHKPLEAIYTAEISGTAAITSLTDLRVLSAPNVSVVVGQDGGAIGLRLFRATGKSIGCVGTTLGAVSFAAVNEDIAWVGKFNIASTEFDVLNFSNGQILTALSDGTINNVDTYGYIFLKKHIGISGSYFDDSHTAVTITSDYAYIENNRTINKAIRGLRTFLLPQLASPLVLNSDGTIKEDVISYYKSLCSRALDVMQRDFEISAYSVVIDPTQNVLSTSELVINVSIVPVGVARTITVNVGFALAV
jgi:hypothetical protein